MNIRIGLQSQRMLGLAQAALSRLRSLPGAGIIENTLRAYGDDRASVLAAALSYYTLLSLFPLMLFILAVTSTFLESESAIREVTRFVGSYLPNSSALLRSSLEEVTRLRGPLTIVAAGGFLWSASGVFDLMQLGLNRAFSVQNARPVWRQRMVSLAMVAGVSLLFAVSFLETTALRLAMHYAFLPRRDVILEYISPLTSFLLGIFVFGMLYRYIPYDRTIRWRDIWVAAALASALWELGKLVFAWYLTNMAVLNLVYGSVGAIIAVMLWGYITAVIMLMGAELAAVMSGARERNKSRNDLQALQLPPQDLSQPLTEQAKHEV